MLLHPLMTFRAGDLYGNVLRIRENEFFDLEGDGFDGVTLEQIGSELFSEGFDELAGMFGDVPLGVLRDVEIIDRSGKAVGMRGVGDRVDTEVERDEQFLRLGALLVRDTNVGPRFKVNDADEIGHGRGGCGWGR